MKKNYEKEDSPSLLGGGAGERAKSWAWPRWVIAMNNRVRSGRAKKFRVFISKLYFAGKYMKRENGGKVEDNKKRWEKSEKGVFVFVFEGWVVFIMINERRKEEMKKWCGGVLEISTKEGVSFNFEDG